MRKIEIIIDRTLIVFDEKYIDFDFTVVFNSISMSGSMKIDITSKIDDHVIGRLESYLMMLVEKEVIGSVEQCFVK